MQKTAKICDLCHEALLPKKHPFSRLLRRVLRRVHPIKVFHSHTEIQLALCNNALSCRSITLVHCACVFFDRAIFDARVRDPGGGRRLERIGRGCQPFAKRVFTLNYFARYLLAVRAHHTWSWMVAESIRTAARTRLLCVPSRPSREAYFHILPPPPPSPLAAGPNPLCLPPSPNLLPSTTLRIGVPTHRRNVSPAIIHEYRQARAQGFNHQQWFSHYRCYVLHRPFGLQHGQLSKAGV